MKICISFATACFLILAFPAKADVRLPVIFQSNMVLQRDKPIVVWGWADRGEKIEVSLNGRTVAAVANKSGKWRVALPALPAGGPHSVIVKGKNIITLDDVMIGDVWICGGQSNMQWMVSQTGYIESDSAFLQRADVRLFTVQVDTDYMPREDINGGQWKILSSENIQSFSAVAYHFGKFLSKELNVPIGLISDNLGATAVEAWMSNESLLAFPQFEALVGPIVKEGKNFAQLHAAFEKTKAAWHEQYHKGTGFSEEWFKPETNTSDWKAMKVSGNTWEEVDNLQNYDGAVWFRTTFDLPENFEGNDFPISLSQIDDHDITWVNGYQIGETYGRHNHRNYTVPSRLLKKKGNVLVVRVLDTGGIGGFTTASFWAGPILSGEWLYKKDASIDIKKLRIPNLPNVTPFSSPAA